MSFEPRLLIKKSDLSKYESELENYYLEKDSEKKSVLEYLNKTYRNSNEIKIDKLILISCLPEPSYFNEIVREQLNEWKITFGIDL